MEQQQHQRGQHGHMVAGHAEDMGDAQLVEGGAVILGEEIPGAQKHRSGIAAGLLAHHVHQPQRQVVAHLGHPSPQGEARFAGLQALSAI